MEAERSNPGETAARLLKNLMLIVCTAGDGEDNERSDYASGEISGGFDSTGHSHGIGVRDLVAGAGIVAGFGVSCAHLSFLLLSLSVC
jgi:hypothetical protein